MDLLLSLGWLLLSAYLVSLLVLSLAFAAMGLVRAWRTPAFVVKIREVDHT